MTQVKPPPAPQCEWVSTTSQSLDTVVLGPQHMSLWGALSLWARFQMQSIAIGKTSLAWSNTLTQRYTQKASLINYMGPFAHMKKVVMQRTVARCLLIQPCPVTFLPGDSISFRGLRLESLVASALFRILMTSPGLFFTRDSD